MAEPLPRTQSDIPVAISSQVTNALLFNADEPSPEQQPLVDRRDPVTQNRARFERNQRLAAQGLMIASGILILLLLIAITAWMALFVYFFVKGFMVYASYADVPCDQPLSTWLLLILLLPIMQGAGHNQQQHSSQRELINFIIRIILLVLGMYWMSQSKTCEKTNPHLYNFVHSFLIFLGVSWTTFGLLPLLIVPIVFFGMRNGWFDGINGADADTIKNMDTVQFDASLFSSEPADNLPEPECCVCSETFGPDREIKRTPCQHYFHEECLGKWLKIAKSCPLCRKDLEDAVLGGDPAEAV